MSLFTSLGNTLHRASVQIRRTRVRQNLLARSDRKLHDSAHRPEQEDPACALRQAIHELNCYNDPKLTEMGMNHHAQGKVVHRSQAEIQLANWGAEQGNWGQRFAA